METRLSFIDIIGHERFVTKGAKTLVKFKNLKLTMNFLDVDVKGRNFKTEITQNAWNNIKLADPFAKYTVGDVLWLETKDILDWERK